MRIFIGIPCHEEVKNQIENIKTSILKDTEKYHSTDQDNFHVTLFFIGESDLEFVERLDNELKKTFFDMSPFQISYDHIGTFKKQQGDILWLGISEGKSVLKKIHHLILTVLNDLSFPIQNTSFSPHLTLARQVKLKDTKKDMNIKIATIKDQVNQIIIYLSHQQDGKLTYTPIKTIHLKKKGESHDL